MSPGPVLDVAAALKHAAAWRAAGESVALVRGSFDLLSAAHARLLAACRARADRMIVAVRSDADAHERLGAGRPILPVEERARLVAGLRGADGVVIAGDDDARALADAIGAEAAIVDADAEAHSDVLARVRELHQRKAE